MVMNEDLREIKDNFLLEDGLADSRKVFEHVKEEWSNRGTKPPLNQDFDLGWAGKIRFYSDTEALYTQGVPDVQPFEPMAFYYIEALPDLENAPNRYESNITNWTADSTDPSSMTSAAVYKGIITKSKGLFSEGTVEALDSVEYSDIKDLENIPSLYDPKKDSFYFENELLDRYIISKNGRGGKPPKFKN